MIGAFFFGGTRRRAGNWSALSEETALEYASLAVTAAVWADMSAANTMPRWRKFGRANQLKLRDALRARYWDSD